MRQARHAKCSPPRRHRAPVLADEQPFVPMRHGRAGAPQLFLQLVGEALGGEVGGGHAGNLIHRPSFAGKEFRRIIMAKTSMSQRKTMGRVMHEYAHGELKSGPRGKGGKVKSRAPGDRHRARGGRRVQVREQDREPAQPRAAARPRKRPAAPPSRRREGKAPRRRPRQARELARRWAARTPRPRRGARRAGAPRERPPDVFQSVRNGQAIVAKCTGPQK